LVFILTPKEEVVYECEIKSQYEIYNVEDVTDIKFEDEIVGNDTLTFYIGNDKVIIVEPEISYVCEE
jgi:GTP cyclohydrolase III